MSSPDVHLREITDENREAVCALGVRGRQKRFVASVPRSLRDAAKARRQIRGTEPCTAVTSRSAS